MKNYLLSFVSAFALAVVFSALSLISRASLSVLLTGSVIASLTNNTLLSIIFSLTGLVVFFAVFYFLAESRPPRVNGMTSRPDLPLRDSRSGPYGQRSADERARGDRAMLKKTLAIATIATSVAAATLSPPASAGDPLLGALVGAGIGAAIGHGVNGSNGAWVGGTLGAVTGASIAANSGARTTAAVTTAATVTTAVGTTATATVERRPRMSAPAPVQYYGAARAYYGPPAVYAPVPVYVAPRVVVRSRPVLVQSYVARYPAYGRVYGPSASRRSRLRRLPGLRARRVLSPAASGAATAYIPPISTAWPSPRQRSMPPVRLATWAKPARCRIDRRLRRAGARAADGDQRAVARQLVRRARPSSPSGISFAPRMCPSGPTNSSGSRTSMISTSAAVSSSDCGAISQTPAKVKVERRPRLLVGALVAAPAGRSAGWPARRRRSSSGAAGRGCSCSRRSRPR